MDSNREPINVAFLLPRNGNDKTKNPYSQIKETVELIDLNLNPNLSTVKEISMETKKGIRKEVKIKLSPLKKGTKGRGRRRMKETASIILPSPMDLLLILLPFSRRNPVYSDQKRVQGEYHCP